MNQSTGHTLLRHLGRIFISLILIVGIIIAWLMKMSGMVLMRAGEFLLLKLTNK
jgi:hypothetical protein